MDDKDDKLPVDVLVSAYRKIRDRIEEANKAHEDTVSKLKAKMELISAELLDFCNEKGVDSFKTSEGTVTRTVQTRYWTNDWGSIYGFIKENDAYHLLERRISTSNMKQFLEENPDTFPAGLQTDNSYVIRIRKPTSKA